MLESPSAMSLRRHRREPRLRRVELREHEDGHRDDCEQRGRDVDEAPSAPLRRLRHGRHARNVTSKVTSRAGERRVHLDGPDDSVFSTGIAAKAWFASAAVFFAVIQVLTGARIFGKLQRVVRSSAPTSTASTAGRAAWRSCARCRSPSTASSSSASRPTTPASSRTRPRDVRLRRARGEAPLRPRPRPPTLDAATRRRHALHRAGAPLEHVEPLVLHERSVRLLKTRTDGGRLARPGVTRSRV